jgi:hypothetical protein
MRARAGWVVEQKKEIDRKQGQHGHQGGTKPPLPEEKVGHRKILRQMFNFLFRFLLLTAPLG